MSKELKCRAVGFDCEGVVTGDTEDDVLTQAAAHVQEVHGMSGEQAGEPAFADQVRAQIHDKV